LSERDIVYPMGVCLDLIAQSGGWWRRAFDIFRKRTSSRTEIEIKVPSAYYAVAASRIATPVVRADGTRLIPGFLQNGIVRVYCEAVDA